MKIVLCVLIAAIAVCNVQGEDDSGGTRVLAQLLEQIEERQRRAEEEQTQDVVSRLLETIRERRYSWKKSESWAGCYWEGNAPFCASDAAICGKAKSGWAAQGYNKNGEGSHCMFGKKILCCPPGVQGAGGPGIFAKA